MRLMCLSDLHNEFSGYKFQIPEPKSEVDLIILLGDIGVGLYAIEWAIRQSERLNLPIFYVLGNHELYNHDLTLVNQAKEYCNNSNVKILEKDSIEYLGYTFVGTTFWTNYELHGIVSKAFSMHAAKTFMSDHSLIKNADGSIFQPTDALRLHQESVYWLKSELYKFNNRHTIVLTHHASIPRAIGPKYRGDVLSPCFASDYSELMVETKPLAWLFGHTHHNYTEQVFDTFVSSNQRGYRGEGVGGFDPELIIDLDDLK